MEDTNELKPNTFTRYIWNSEEGKVLGRTGSSWGLILLFYLGLYTFLIAWMAMCVAVFYETLTYTEPKWYGEDSLTKDNPGLGFRPMPQYDTTLIRFQQGKPSSYKPYTDHLEAFLLPYEPELQTGRNLVTCLVNANYQKESDQKACTMDLDAIIGKSECTKEKDFGYEDGEPCILLKMNRVFGFVPQPYLTVEELMEDNGLKTKPRFLAFTPNLTIAIGCEGQNPADRENIEDGGIEFYPSIANNNYEGLPTISFPYLNQEGYRSPFVMMKIRKFTKRVVIQMICKLYAKNIDNSGTPRRHGTLKFEILRD